MDPNYPPPPNASSPPVVVQGLPPAIFTAMLGALMLLLGIIIGYLSHPMVTAYVVPATPTAIATNIVASTTAAPVITQAPANTQVALVDTQATSVARATQTAGLMGAVLPRVRHFKGNEAAPVTLIEFGDFQ